MSILDIQQMIIDAANRLGVPPNLALGIASHESGFNPAATNKNTNGTTDYGVMQLNTTTVQTLGVADAMDPQQNIDAGVGLLSNLLKMYGGDVTKALWAYADGSGSVAANRMSSVAQQFIGYVTGYGGGPPVDPLKRVPPPRIIQAAKVKTTPPGSSPSGSRSSHLAGWFLATISLLCMARASAQVRQDTLTLQAPAPAPVTQVSTNVTGQRSGINYFYWVVANYPGGSAQPMGVLEPNAPFALSMSNFVTVQWSTAIGAISYDVLRTLSETFPGAQCNCAVATAVTGNSTTDTGAALSAYVFTPKAPATGTIRIDNTGASPAFVANPPIGGGLVTIDASTIASANQLTITGIASAYIGTPTNCPTSLGSAQVYYAFMNVSNGSNTAPTLQICGKPAVVIVHRDGTPLYPNELDASGGTACGFSNWNGTTIQLTPNTCSRGATPTGTPTICASAVQTPASGLFTPFFDACNNNLLSIIDSSRNVSVTGMNWSDLQTDAAPISMSGSTSVAMYTVNLPPLPPGRCFYTDFAIGNNTAAIVASSSLTAWIDFNTGSPVQIVNLVGSLAGVFSFSSQFRYCNQPGVQNAQIVYYNFSSSGYSTSANQPTVLNAPVDWIIHAPTAVDMSLSHTLTIRAGAGSSTVNRAIEHTWIQ